MTDIRQSWEVARHAMRGDHVTLSVIGIDTTQQQVYRALLAQPAATVAELAEALELPARAVASALDAIADLGLVSPAASARDRYVPAPPAVALGSMLTRHRDDLSRAEMVVTELAERYQNAIGNRSARDVIEVLSGVAAIRHRFDQVQRSATDEVMAFVKSPATVVSAMENLAEDQAVQRGVNYRVLIERAQVEATGFLDLAAEAIGRGQQVRVTESLPIKLVIADHRLALLPLLDTGESSAALVHGGGLLDALTALFENIWSRSMPLVLDATNSGSETSQASGIGAENARILSLLLAGLTDQTVAAQLGLSMRTVQRRIRGLMDDTGTQTRIQLGWYAARHGWV